MPIYEPAQQTPRRHQLPPRLPGRSVATSRKPRNYVRTLYCHSVIGLPAQIGTKSDRHVRDRFAQAMGLASFLDHYVTRSAATIGVFKVGWPACAGTAKDRKPCPVRAPGRTDAPPAEHDPSWSWFSLDPVNAANEGLLSCLVDRADVDPSPGLCLS